MTDIAEFLRHFESVRRRTGGVETPPLYGLTEPQVKERGEP